MKIFKYGLCYVDYKELTRFALPDYVSVVKPVITGDRYVTISGNKSVAYVESRKDIIDYSDVCNLSDEELDERVSKAYAQLEPYTKALLAADEEGYTKLRGNFEFSKNLDIYTDIYFGLLEYKLNREAIDEAVHERTAF